MSFSTLPPDSRTLVSKWNTKLALIWKEDFGPLGNSPVLLLLSSGKTPLTTTVAKFLDTSVCGALDALTPASVHSLWISPKFLNRMNVAPAFILPKACAGGPLHGHVIYMHSRLAWTVNKHVNKQLPRVIAHLAAYILFYRWITEVKGAASVFTQPVHAQLVLL